MAYNTSAQNRTCHSGTTHSAAREFPWGRMCVAPDCWVHVGNATKRNSSTELVIQKKRCEFVNLLCSLQRAGAASTSEIQIGGVLGTFLIIGAGRAVRWGQQRASRRRHDKR